MKITKITRRENHLLYVVAEDGREGFFNVAPYLKSEAFARLRDRTEFERVHSGGYFLEWDCGADLSADTVEAHWQIVSIPRGRSEAESA